MKKKIIFGFLCLLSLTTVNATEYGEPISSIIKDNTLYVDMEVPTTEEEFANVKSILNEQYKGYLQNNETSTNQSLYLTDCSSDYSTCYVVYSACSVADGGCGDTPIPDVSIKWKENYSDLFTKIAPNGVFEINAIKPTDKIHLVYYTETYFVKLYPDYSVSGTLNNCNDDYTQCTLDVYSDGKNEQHEVTVKWEETNSQIKSEVDAYIKKIESSYTYDEEGIFTYVLSDLNKINFIRAHQNKDIEYFQSISEAIQYSPEALEVLNDNTYDLYLKFEAANDETILDYYALGTFIVYRDGVMYGVIDDLKLEYRNVIYIPDETENSSEAFISATEKRIKEYLGNNITVKVEVAGKRADYKTLGGFEVDYSIFGDESKMSDYYYKVTIGEVVEEFVIVKDSSKIETPKYDKKDTKTEITVSSISSEVPLDTVIKVEVIETVSKVFTKINEVLKLDDKEEVQVYDIKLFSESSNKYITKLANGEFKVSVPIKESLKGKNLVAYYVTDDNKIEEHPVTVVDGIATFTTTHFSVYTIAEKATEDSLDEEVPATGDKVMTYVTVGMIGLIGLGTGIVLRKREN